VHVRALKRKEKKNRRKAEKWGRKGSKRRWRKN
jgi:hypothetical protein